MPLFKQPSKIVAAASKILLTVFFIWLLILCCTGCYPVRKMERQVTRGHNTYPAPFAKLVAGWYPPILVSDSTAYEYLPGRLVSIPHFITIDCDSAVAAAQATGKPALVRQPCPPSERRVDTFRKTTVRVVQDSLAMAAKNATIHDLQDSVAAGKLRHEKTIGVLEETRRSRNSYRTNFFWLLGGFVVIVALGVWRTVRKYPQLLIRK